MSPISRFLHHRTNVLSQGEPVALPITASSTFQLAGDPDGAHFYSRNGNPTVEAVEAAIGLIEDAECVLFPSGMAAIAAVFEAHLAPGETVLVHSDGYYNVRGLLKQFFVPRGVVVREAPIDRIAEADMTGCKLVFAETPANPGLSVCDLRALSARAHAAGALVAVDNTTPNPLAQQPLDLGADLSVMADTKAMAGHSDLLAGHVASRNPALLARVRDYRRLAGAIISPFDAWLLHRGLETLELRTTRANANAMAVASFLRDQKGVRDVRYPGLSNDPSFAIASSQMRSFGPILNFTLPSRAKAEAFIAAHPLLAAATSFGGTHSSAECRIRWGDAVPEGFVRFACGIEPAEDLIAATEEALRAIG